MSGRNISDQNSNNIERKHTERFFRNKSIKYAKDIVDQLTVKELEYSPKDLLVFIDDSGDFVINEHNKYIAFGGVAFAGDKYALIKKEWLKIKYSLFGLSANELFHATDCLHKLSNVDLSKLEFFLARVPFESIAAWDTVNDRFINQDIRKDVAIITPLSVVE